MSDLGPEGLPHPERVLEQTKADEARRAQGRYDKKIEDSLSWVLSTPKGRFWVWDVLRRCKMLSTAYRDNDRDTAFCLGEQNIGIQIFAQLNRNPERFAEMMRENNE